MQKHLLDREYPLMWMKVCAWLGRWFIIVGSAWVSSTLLVSHLHYCKVILHWAHTAIWLSSSWWTTMATQAWAKLHNEIMSSTPAIIHAWPYLHRCCLAVNSLSSPCLYWISWGSLQKAEVIMHDSTWAIFTPGLLHGLSVILHSHSWLLVNI